MRYFELTDDVHVPTRWHLGEVVDGEARAPRLHAGLRFPGGTLHVGISRPGMPLDFSLTSFAVPIARVSLADAFEQVAGADVQRLPVMVDGATGFEVLNVVRVVRCLDESRSQFLKWTERDHRADLAGQYRMVTRLKVVGPEIPVGVHAFRIEAWPIALVVSEQLKAAMEHAGCLGAKFEEVT